MNRNLLLLGATLVACLAFAVPTQDTRPQDDSKKIDALARLLDLERLKTADLQARVERIEAWFNMVRSASEILDSAANEARREGFEAAGANPLSRAHVLDGMKSFASELSRNVPGPAQARPPR
jgi:hypothetical protein